MLLALAAVAVGAALRLWDLPGQGITNYDEAVHILEARFMRAGFARNVLGQTPPWDGLPLMHAKPLHAALIAVAQGVLGDHPWTGALVSALFSAGAILLVYHLGRRIWGAAAGVLSAAFLAAMPWSLLYGRMALAEADSTFFVLLCVWLQVGAFGRVGESDRQACADGGSCEKPFRAVLRRLVRPALAGMAGGLAFLSNYRWGPLLLLLFLGIEILRLRREHAIESETRGRWIELPPRLVAFGLAGALLVLLTDVVYGLAVLGPLLDAPTRPRTYLEDLAHNIGKFERMGVGLRDPLRLPLYLWVFGGPVLLAGLAAASGFLLRGILRWRSAWGRGRPGREIEGSVLGDRSDLEAVCLLAAIPVLLFLLTPSVFPRGLSAALPAWALLSGWGTAQLFAWIARAGGGPESQTRSTNRTRSTAVLTGMVALVIGLQAVLGQGVWFQHSGYGIAAEWLRSRGASRCVSTQSYALRVYGIDAIGVPSANDLAPAVRNGYRYLLLDNQAWIGPHIATCRALRATLRPVATIPHPSGGDASFVWEAPQASVAAGRARANGPDWFKPSVILVYDLGGSQAR